MLVFADQVLAPDIEDDVDDLLILAVRPTECSEETNEETQSASRTSPTQGWLQSLPRWPGRTGACKAELKLHIKSLQAQVTQLQTAARPQSSAQLQVSIAYRWPWQDEAGLHPRSYAHLLDAECVGHSGGSQLMSGLATAMHNLHTLESCLAARWYAQSTSFIIGL
jgi:hypothetical protein